VTSAVDEALTVIRRADFLPESAAWAADAEEPVPIGRGQTNSQPRTVAFMLELLDVRPGQRVLDVGAGSGWTTALLGQLVGPSGEVIGLELEPELVDWGAANLARYEMAWTSIRQARSGRLGDASGAPYDRILVSAAPSLLPQELVDQLADDGPMSHTRERRAPTANSQAPRLHSIE